MLKRFLVTLVGILLITSMLGGAAAADGSLQSSGTSKKVVSIFVHDRTGNLVEYAVPAPATATTNLEAALTALLTHPLPSELWREIPSGTKLNSVSLKKGAARIDLSREFLDNLTDNMSVSLIKESVLYTAYQFTEVASVLITVDGIAPGDRNGQGMGGPFFKMQLPPPPVTAEQLGAHVNPLNLLAPAPRVWIDAGHGGTDPGKVASDGTLEKDINLDVAQKLKSYLQGQNGIVGMTRTNTDTYVKYVTTDPRLTSPKINNSDKVTVPNLAQSFGANILISIHANAASDPLVRGFEIYYNSNASYVSGSKDLATRIFNFFNCGRSHCLNHSRSL
jgi:N-acetylmuramoyl-L-alanine amidase